jgi:hypothetical protein
LGFNGRLGHTLLILWHRLLWWLCASTRMTAGVNLLKLFDGDFRVDGRGVEFLMAEQLLDEADVGPVLQQALSLGVRPKQPFVIQEDVRKLGSKSSLTARF